MRLVALPALAWSTVALCSCGASAGTSTHPERAHSSGGQGAAVGVMGGGCGAGCPQLGVSQGIEPDVERLGCHRYCSQASEDGSDGHSGRPMARVKIVGPVTLVHGALPITLTCAYARPCEGALLVGFRDRGGGATAGRGDLDLGADISGTVGIPLSPGALQRLSSAGKTEMVVVADVRPSLKGRPVRRGGWDPWTVAELSVSGPSVYDQLKKRSSGSAAPVSP